MKWIVFFTLIIFLILMIFISVGLFTYIKELKALPHEPRYFNNEGEKKDCKDYEYYILFAVSIVINLLIMSSCTIIVFQ